MPWSCTAEHVGNPALTLELFFAMDLPPRMLMDGAISRGSFKYTDQSQPMRMHSHQAAKDYCQIINTATFSVD